MADGLTEDKVVQITGTDGGYLVVLTQSGKMYITRALAVSWREIPAPKLDFVEEE
jgi:hypothetical protein